VIVILLPNNQRQHRTLHTQKDVLPYALCYLLCPVSAALVRIFRSPPPTTVIREIPITVVLSSLLHPCLRGWGCRVNLHGSGYEPRFVMGSGLGSLPSDAHLLQGWRLWDER